jgi:hypothetical protein
LPFAPVEGKRKRNEEQDKDEPELKKYMQLSYAFIQVS